MHKTTSEFMKQAEAFCREHGHRFTAPRRQVLEILHRAKKPVGAYPLIDAMPPGTNPPTVYRALEFWQEVGFVHSISSLNVFMICDAGHRHRGSQFMICDACGDVEEVHLCDLPPPLQKRIDDKSFTLSSWNAELHGTCRDCQI